MVNLNQPKKVGKMIFDCAYLIELLTPKRSNPQQVEEHMNRFAERYRRIMDSGNGLSIPDNPMGQRRFSALEAIDRCNLAIDSAKIVMNLNTFHTKEELDGLLKTASENGLRHLLIIRGDGGPELPKLNPASIGGKKSIATSIDLLRYINAEYADDFVTGAAFNPYSPISFEMDKLKQKIEAGAKYIVTQPVIGKDPQVDSIMELGVPVVIEAWMSKNVDLLFKSVRKQSDSSSEGYDPVENLKILHDSYPQSCVYLSMLSFKQDWKLLLPRL
jgi:methylenetetrahydrofolate reductase (NADPH)